ncbi:hypothetical protein JWH04_15335 [Xanthomonas melonis]|uniref:hypothetical protein n=1 Tax=Xanthomonas melonis TaxID=56456 RepID=UPI001E5381D9|nr:hypothetical protein [Xanthomonas melonis]MCD0280285.1 hypothetical protein [Xanthomonas melonis]
MKHALIALFALVFSGCASTAMPNFYNGNYYMAGDPGCVQMRALSSTRIMCVDKKGNDSGYRDAMTYEQVQIYQIQMTQQQIQMQQLSQSMQQAGQTFQNAGEQIRQQSQSWAPPQVQPISPQGSGNTTYRQVGNTWMGSNGSSCQVVGQSILCSDGKRCQMVGQNLICN